MKKHDSKLTIFLDIDGVLNTDKTVQRTPDGYRGIGDSRVELLANVIDKYGGADIVLSSDWKDIYRKNWERLILTKGIENSQLASETPAIEALIFMDYIKEMS